MISLNTCSVRSLLPHSNSVTSPLTIIRKFNRQQALAGGPREPTFDEFFIRSSDASNALPAISGKRNLGRVDPSDFVLLISRWQTEKKGNSKPNTVSVTVSILTLTFISIDRWYAICFPLRFKSTTGRAKNAIIGIWTIALLFDIPDFLVLHTVPPTHIKIKTILFTQCDMSWSQRSQVAFTIVKLIFLYTGPLIFMSVAYWQIVKVLWRSDIPGHNLSSRASQMSQIPPTGGGNPEVQLRSRRKAAKMLVTVVITFAICYFPVHLLSVLRYTTTLPSNKWINAISLIAHGLCYFNSAVNPLIYNFMSVKFRREFGRTFQKCTPLNDHKPNQEPSHACIANEYRSTTQSRRKFRKEFRRTFRCSRESNTRIQRGYLASTSNLPRIKSRTMTIRTTFKNNNNLQRNTEIIPLSAITSVQQNEKHD
ncbi:unnamed protein product [Heterotrigona itama]|uniref:G-protein coupled receptors family 1 profile domain-containing protein n=1 Tax=Heterotrigona itama TaxID=395501 RepID=A0A6V7HB58_9HYME|nr:unnamed protein product [Heterotrigona itama]